MVSRYKVKPNEIYFAKLLTAGDNTIGPFRSFVFRSIDGVPRNTEIKFGNLDTFGEEIRFMKIYKQSPTGGNKKYELIFITHFANPMMLSMSDNITIDFGSIFLDPSEYDVEAFLNASK